MSDVLRLENITRRYREGEGQLEVFSDLNLQPARRARSLRWWASPARASPRCCISRACWSADQRRDLYRRRRHIIATGQ